MVISKQDRFAIVVSILLSLLTMGLGLFIVIPYWCYRFYKNDISFLNIQEDYSTVNRPLIKKPITQKNKNLINDIMILYIRPILIISLIMALVLIILQFYQ